MRYLLLAALILIAISASSCVEYKTDFSSWYLRWEGQDITGNSLALFNDDTIYVAGRFNEYSDFDPGPRENIPEIEHSGGVFLARLNDRAELEWISVVDVTSGIRTGQCAVDSDGNIVMTGQFDYRIDFAPFAEGGEIDSNGCSDVYLCKYTPDGSLDWACVWGGMGFEEHPVSAASADGRIYVAGKFSNTVDFDPGEGIALEAEVETDPSMGDAFLSCFLPDGDFEWVTTSGGKEREDFCGITVDPENNLVLSGLILPNPFDTGQGSVDYQCGWLSRYSSDGDLLWERRLGEGGETRYGAVDCDSHGNIYVSGSFSGTVDLDPGRGNRTVTSTGETSDMLLSRFEPSGELQWCREWIPESGVVSPGSLCVDPFDCVIVSGTVQGTVDLDPGEGIHEFTVEGHSAVFVSKFNRSGELIWTFTIDGKAPWCRIGISDLATDSRGTIYLLGDVYGFLELDDAEVVPEDEYEFGNDMFLLKLPPNGRM